MTGTVAPRLLFLRQRADIERVKKLGRRFQTSLFTILTCTSDLPAVRVGIIVGKRFGGAVVRNRAKRIFRELARHSSPHLVGQHDILIFPRRQSLAVRHAVLKETWHEVLRQQKLRLPA